MVDLFRGIVIFHSGFDDAHEHAVQHFETESIWLSPLILSLRTIYSDGRFQSKLDPAFYLKLTQSLLVLGPTAFMKPDDYEEFENVVDRKYFSYFFLMV